MNPNQPPGNPIPGGTPTPPSAPQPNDAPITEIPEEAFGFADEQPQLPPVQPIPPQPQPVMARPAPPLTPPPRPQPQSVPIPVTQTPTTSAPTPQNPVTPAPTPTTADIMPPQQIPTVPTLAAPSPAAPTPQPSIQPATPEPTSIIPVPPTSTQPGANVPFDPATVPVHAWSSPENPITATYSPQPVTHLPDDIAARINEKPMQNSGDIMRQVKHGLDGSRLKSILSFIIFTASIFLAAFFINQFIFQSYYVEGNSMTPTLQNDDRLIISKVERTLASIQGKPYIPQRGQIVVLDSSIVGLNGQHEQLIKRVVGLPGDHIHIEAGTVIITNSEHPNGYDVAKALGLTNLQATFVEEPIDVTVPEGYVYVMGDNREQGGSYDSRAFGPIEGDKIQGRLWGRILPLDKAQLY